MAEIRWIKTFVFLMLALMFSAAVTRQYSPSFVVRDGDEVTLPCETVTDDQHGCGHTDWLFSGSPRTTTELVTRGKLHGKSDRLSVAANCSLLIKKVTVENDGYYTCRRSGGQDAHVHLFLMRMTEHDDGGRVTLSCSVPTHDFCMHTVKWLYEGKSVDEEPGTDPRCSVAVTFLAADLKEKSKYTCNVSDINRKVQLFPFNRQSSAEKPGDDATTTGTTGAGEKTSRTNRTVTTIDDASTPFGWWVYIVVALGLAALVTTVVAVIRRKRTKGEKPQMDENAGQILNPAVTQSAPATRHDTAEPEDGVSYASISYTKKTNGKAQVRVRDDDDDGGDTVIYVGVKVSSPSAGASADPSDLYAAVNKPTG